MEDWADVRSNNWADVVGELDFADVQAGWDEDSVAGKPESISSSTHGDGGNVLSRLVLEGDGASAALISVMGERLDAHIIHHVSVW